jgi:hypothetical protein
MDNVADAWQGRRERRIIATSAKRTRMMRRTNCDGSTDMAITSDFLRTAQHQAERAAGRLSGCESAMSTLAGAGLRLTELSHRCADGLLNQSLASARGALADGVSRLRTAAQADSWSTLYRGQLEATPASRQRLASEVAATWRIVASAGRELGVLASETARELAGEAGSARSSRRTRRRSRPDTARL